MKTILIFTAIVSCLGTQSFAQQVSQADSLKSELLALKTEVERLNLRVYTSQKRLKNGIIVSALGYSVTIAGGLMLGRENDAIGQVLLVAGGAMGVTGTGIMIYSLSLGGDKKPRKKRR